MSRNQTSEGWRWRAGFHFLFALLAGIISGAALGWIGGLLAADARVALATLIGIIGMMLGIAGMMGKSSWIPQCNRETAQGWLHRGPWLWALLNGVALGFGARTRIGFWLWFAIPAGALLIGDPWFGAAAWGTYAGVRGGFPGAAIVVVGSRRDFTELSDWLLSRRQLAMRVSSGMLLLIGLTTVLITGPSA